jgi:fatty acid desaturase
MNSARSKTGVGPIQKTRFLRESTSEKEFIMLWTLFAVLLVLWALGLLTGYTMGGVVHVLLVVAIIVMVAQVLQGRKRV